MQHHWCIRVPQTSEERLLQSSSPLSTKDCTTLSVFGPSSPSQGTSQSQTSYPPRKRRGSGGEAGPAKKAKGWVYKESRLSSWEIYESSGMSATSADQIWLWSLSQVIFSALDITDSFHRLDEAFISNSVACSAFGMIGLNDRWSSGEDVPLDVRGAVRRFQITISSTSAKWSYSILVFWD